MGHPSGPTQTQVQQSSIPEWQQQDWQSLYANAGGLAQNALRNGAPQQRIAGQQPGIGDASILSNAFLTGNQNRLTDQSRGIASNLANAQSSMGSPAQFGNQLIANNPFAGYHPNINAPQIGAPNQIHAPQVAGAQVAAPQQVGTQNWNGATAAQYMNPYEQQVLGVQQQMAKQQLGQQQAGLDQQAAASGALGGDRNAVMQSNLLNDYNLNQQNIQAQGLQNAYQSGQQQFTSDQSRNLEAGIENSQLGLSQGITNAQMALAAQNQNANLGFAAQNQNVSNSLAQQMQNAQLGLAGQIQNANLGFGALGQDANINQQALNAQLGLFGADQQNAYAQNANSAGLSNNLEGLWGATSQLAQPAQQYQQSVLNARYNNQLNNNLWGEQQSQYLGGILSGMPYQGTSQQDMYGPQQSPWSSLAGGLMGGLGMFI